MIKIKIALEPAWASIHGSSGRLAARNGDNYQLQGTGSDAERPDKSRTLPYLQLKYLGYLPMDEYSEEHLSK